MTDKQATCKYTIAGERPIGIPYSRTCDEISTHIDYDTKISLCNFHFRIMNTKVVEFIAGPNTGKFSIKVLGEAQEFSIVDTEKEAEALRAKHITKHPNKKENAMTNRKSTCDYMMAGGNPHPATCDDQAQYIDAEDNRLLCHYHAEELADKGGIVVSLPKPRENKEQNSSIDRELECTCSSRSLFEQGCACAFSKSKMP